MYITNPRGKRRPPSTFGTPVSTPAPTNIPSVQNSAPPTPVPQGMGNLIVRVTTASGAIPVEGAYVYVYSYNTESGGDLISSQKTNSSGLTEKIPLPAPPRSLSLAPDRDRPYSSYNIKVHRDGYNTQQYISAPIFDGITSVQSADLVPLPENGETDRADPYNSGIFYEGQPSALEHISDPTAPENNS